MGRLRRIPTVRLALLLLLMLPLLISTLGLWPSSSSSWGSVRVLGLGLMAAVGALHIGSVGCCCLCRRWSMSLEMFVRTVNGWMIRRKMMMSWMRMRQCWKTLRMRGRRRRRWRFVSCHSFIFLLLIAGVLLAFQSPKGNPRRATSLWARLANRTPTSPSRRLSLWEQIRLNVV